MLFIRRQLDRLTCQSGQSSLDGRGSGGRQSRHFLLNGRGSGGRQSRHFLLDGRGSACRQSRHFLLDATLALLVLIPWLLGAAACQRTERGATAVVPAPPPLSQPGATKVPTSVGTVILSNIGPLGGSVTLTTTGSTVAAGSFGSAPSPLPSGAATPQPGATAQAASIPTLFANSTYTLNFTGNSVTGSSCAPPQAGGALGTFST